MPISREEYLASDAIALASKIKRGEANAHDLLEHAIQLAEERNPALNAIVTPLHDFAEQQIAELDKTSPLYGVPFLVKDLTCQFKGTPYSAGSNAFKQYISNHDTELAKRFKNAGLVTFGKTNTPELGLMGTTEPAAHGATHNPWAHGRSSGGSSGGSAAVVAAEIVPMASAGDGGGSIRIPASACGLFGLKPSRYRTPAGPDYSEHWDGAALEHVISRSVRDSAMMLDITNGLDVGSPVPLEQQNGYLQACSSPISPLKIAYCTESPLGTEVCKETTKSILHTVNLLQSLGHSVEEVQHPVNGHDVATCYFTMYFGHVAADMQAMCEELGVSWNRLNVEMPTRTLGNFGRALSAADFVTSKRKWNHLARTMGAFHQRYDLYLCPVWAQAPAPHGAFDPEPLDALSMRFVNATGLHRLGLKTGIIEKVAYKSLEKLPFTQLANLTGQPAMSVPLYWSSQHNDSSTSNVELPMGSQFIAPINGEKTLFSLAAQLEKAQPWFNRRPTNYT